MPRHVIFVRWIALITLFTCGTILIFGKYLTISHAWLRKQSTDWWGASGQWAGAIGSIAAVIVALFVVTRDGRVRREIMEAEDEASRQRLRKENEIAHRIRASRARTVVSGRTEVGLAEIQTDEQSIAIDPIPGIEIVNHGNQPILEVQLEGVEILGEPDHTLDALSFRTSNNSQYLTAHGLRVCEFLGPGAQVGLYSTEFAEIVRHQESNPRVVVTLTFLDTEGHRWRRSGTETPAEITGQGFYSDF